MENAEKDCDSLQERRIYSSLVASSLPFKIVTLFDLVMAIDNSHDPSLLGIFYSYFHNIEGPKLAIQYPPDCISLDTFNSISDYIITKDQLCGNIIRVCVSDTEIIGYPIQISSQHYIRNAFNFNLCFVVKKGNSAEYESMVKKIGQKLESLEREKEFFQNPDSLANVEILIKQVYNGLRDSNKCDIWIDTNTRLLLFPTSSRPSSESTLYEPKDYDVPYLCYDKADIVSLLPDIVMFEPILECIDSIRCVYEINHHLNMDTFQLRACLSYLHEIGVIGFIDLYDLCNIYVLQDFEAIWNENTIKELIAYCRKGPYGKSLDSHKHLLSPRLSGTLSGTSSVKETIEVEDIQALFSLFHPNIALHQIMNNPIYMKIASSIDLHRFIVYSCIHRILRRIYVYPFIQTYPYSFYYYFYNSIQKNQRLLENEDDFVGMSMDSSSYQYDESNEDIIHHENVKASAKKYYQELYNSFQVSLFHYPDEQYYISRHNSLGSFPQDIEITCSCRPDKETVLKLISKHECLESIALHTNSCIPSIMNCIMEIDSVLFLKVYSV